MMNWFHATSILAIALTGCSPSTDGDDDGATAMTSVVPCAYGQGESCPGLDCQDILDTEPTSVSGEFWIDPTGSDSYQVVCDMSTDGGGWTLVMKAINDNYSYYNGVWDSSTLDNETDLDVSLAGTAKYQSFNEVPFTELRSSDNTTLSIHKVETFSSTQTSALDLFSSTGSVYDTIHDTYFNNRAPPSKQAWGCTELNRYGINLYDPLLCTYEYGSTGGLCDHNGGACWGNRTNQYYCSTCGELYGQGWANYACNVEKPPVGWVYAITELMWVR